uniref:RING-CH-type domain-containing protein n=1 Tax=Salix viminalis TaxID=40686 RepID=A0A6N2MXL9_SALVM
MEMFVVSRFGFVFLVVSLSCSVLALPGNGPPKDPLKYILGQENLGPFRNGTSETDAQAPGPSDYTLVLAAKRTDRPDILHGFKRYREGWNITDPHYWASVGFTGAAGFVLAFLWFFLFGFALVAHHCCKWRFNIKDKGSSRSQRICLIMLILFTCAAAIGCILLCVGQDYFHGEAMNTLKYVVNQSDYTVQTLKNVTEYLSLAKTINIAQLVLPSNVMDDIDKLNVDLNAAADTLTEKTSENAGKIVKVFNAVYVSESSAVSIDYCGCSDAYPGSSWFFAISDTCLAMEEWVENPHAASALSSILPCVDQRTTNNTLVQSKEVITDIVNVVNTYIYTFANANPSQTDFNYYNQSGPSMPPLCYPFDSHYQDRQCEPREVSMANASVVWQNYTCMVSSSGLCTTDGRVIPDIYRQLVAAVNESYALEYYTPVLLSLQDCKFVRDTFQEITSSHCPPLEHYLKIVNAGLGLISVGVLLCLVLWILYANCPLSEEMFAKISSPLKCSSGCTGIKIGCTSSGKNDASLSITSVAGAGRGRETRVRIGEEGDGGKEAARGGTGFAEALKVVTGTRDDKRGRRRFRKSGGMPFDEAAIESRNLSMQATASDTKIDKSFQKLDFGDISTPTKLVECRICQDEDEDSNMEAPCSCCDVPNLGQYAHRRCIQKWCNEKGNTICEICLQEFKPGYTAPPPLFQIGFPMNFRGNWETSRRELNGPRFIAVVSSEHNFLNTDYYEYSASTTRNTIYYRLIAVIFMVLLILRHALPLILNGTNNISFPAFMLLFIRVAGIILPIYVMLKTLTALQRRRLRQAPPNSSTHSYDEDAEHSTPQPRPHIINVH